MATRTKRSKVKLLTGSDVGMLLIRAEQVGCSLGV